MSDQHGFGVAQRVSNHVTKSRVLIVAATVVIAELISRILAPAFAAGYFIWLEDQPISAGSAYGLYAEMFSGFVGLPIPNTILVPAGYHTLLTTGWIPESSLMIAIHAFTLGISLTYPISVFVSWKFVSKGSEIMSDLETA